LLAFSPSINTVQLLDLTTLREVVRLSTPHTQNVNALRFSLDSGSLAVGRDNTLINVWDLRGVRQELARLGLDWKMPAIAPAAPTASYKLIKAESHTGKIFPLAVYLSPRRRIEELTQTLSEKPGDVAALIERGRLLDRAGPLEQAEVD
jgi:WD40 repeat protein